MPIPAELIPAESEANTIRQLRSENQSLRSKLTATRAALEAAGECLETPLACFVGAGTGQMIAHTLATTHPDETEPSL